MATGVFFHAHPDDEAIATGGTIAKAKRDGHRVVLVVATNGDEGEPVPGVLRDGELLADRRIREVEQAAALLGVDRLVLFGYRDSGMMGEPANGHADSFWRADTAEAGRRLARVLAEESARVLVVYDDNGVYGHPDHIQVHRVGVRAAELAEGTDVYECSPNRDHMKAMFEQIARANPEFAAERARRDDGGAFGLPESELTHRIDVGDFVALKRDALLLHASQVAPDHPLMAMPDELYRSWMGYEWYRRRGQPRGRGTFATDIFA